MREILFRGKRKTDGEWVFGMPWIFKDHACICPWREGMCKYDTGFYPVHVDPATVGQFTGLTDKNGKKVFEGDILSTENGTFRNTGMGHILFYKGMWTSFYGQDALGRDCFDALLMVCSLREVIGNIHDNPELLEVTG